MDNKKQISQKEYLKKYLSSGKDKKKVKKKKPNLGSKTVKIIDDDIDIKNMRAIEDGEFDIYANTEDGPQIAGIIDERGPVDFSDKRRWKIITDDGYGDISVTSVARNEKKSRDSSLGDEIAASNPSKNQSCASDSDCSPPRKSKQNSDSDEPPRKKSSSKKKRKSGSEDSDISPPRRSRKNSDPDETRRKKSSSKKRSVQNDSGSGDSDISPPRKSRKNSDSDSEPRKKKSKSKKQRRTASSPVQNNSGSEDGDFSPPRRPKKNSDGEESRRKNSRSKKRQNSASTTNKNRSGSEDSDFSPPRRPRKNSDSDLSPPRNSNSKGKERGRVEDRSRDEYSSNSQKKLHSKYDKERENSRKESRWGNYDDRNSRSRHSPSPSPRGQDYGGNSSLSRGRGDSYRSARQGNGNNSSEYKGDYRSKEGRGNQAGNRREKESPPWNRGKTDSDRKDTNTHSRRGAKDSDSDLSPPRESKRKSKNVEPESSSKDNRKKSKNFDPETGARDNRKKSRNSGNPESSLSQKTPFKNYQEMSAEDSGFGQAPVLRDRKTGRRRDLAAEAREQEEKDEKRQQLEEKYAQWGRGLKQVEDRQEKLDRDLYEMSKPLARYADDADLERELKAQEREGDPMLAYMKKKQKKEGKQEPEKPKYNGPSMPNRFGIRPGYRWDGVDRSNGYEKKWFDAQNARKAVQEEAYKWSTADM